MQGVPTHDYESEPAAVLRKLKMAEAMQAGALAPMEMPQQAGAKASWLQPLAKIAQAYVASKNMKSAQEEQGMLGRRYQTDGRAGLERLLEGISAQPGPTPAITGNNPSAYQAPGMQTPQDVAMIKRKAILEAMGSNHPLLQQVGASQLKGLTENQLTAKDLLPHAAPSSIPEMIRSGPAGFKPAKGKPIEVGGTLVDPESLEAMVVKGPGPKRIEFKGDLYEENVSTGQWKKLDNAPKVSTTVHNNMPKLESEFDKALGKGEGERFVKALEARPMQLEGLDAVSRGKELLKEGIHTGILGNVRKDIDKVSGLVAKTDPAKAARTEEFIARMGDVVIPRLKDFGGSDTVEELKYLQSVNAGEITLEAGALGRVLDSVDRKMRARVASTDFTADKLRKSGKLLPTFEAGAMPAPAPVAPPAAPGSAAPMTLDDYLKSKRGGR
jgi:hypothetical protein